MVSTFGESKFKGVFLHFVSCHTHTALDFQNPITASKSTGSNAGTPPVRSHPSTRLQWAVWNHCLQAVWSNDWQVWQRCNSRSQKQEALQKSSHFPLKANCFPSYEIWILPLERFFSISHSREGPLFYNSHQRICFLFLKIDSRGGEREKNKHQSVASHKLPDRRSNPQPKYMLWPMFQPT